MEASKKGDLPEKVMKHSLDIICTVDNNGYFIHVSDACKKILGYEREELEAKPYLSFVHPDDRSETISAVAKISSGSPATSFTNRFLHKSGSEVYISWSSSWVEEELSILGVGRDVTEIKAAKLKLREKEELHNALLEHGEDMQALLDEQLSFKYVGGTILKELGYTPELLLGLNALDFVHQDDIYLIKQSLAEITTNKKVVTVPSFRFRNANGEWRWLETTATNQLSNPAIAALVISSRDVTEQRNAAQAIEKSEQRFRALFENNPNAILIENKEGTIVDINRAGEVLFDLPKEQIIHKPLSPFLPPQARAICIKHLRSAFTGKTIKFELELESDDANKIYLKITKIPVVVEGKVASVHSIIEDVTSITHYYNTVKQQAKKLNTIFESITDAYFTLDTKENFTYINQEFERLLQIDRLESFGKNIWEVFPEEIGGEFYQQYHYALNSGKAVRFKAFLQRLSLWLEVKAFPSEEGLSVYFNDVTEQVKSQQELKKLSLVASNTINGVLFTDVHRRIEWVNEGFTRLTGYTLEDAIGKIPAELLLDDQENDVLRLREQITNGQAVTFEVQTRHKESKKDIWLSVQLNSVKDEEGKFTGYFGTQTDITALKKSEIELAKLAKDLYRQNRDLQQFTYIVSHNLRSPVASALGLLNLLNTADKDSEIYQTILTNLNTSIRQLDTLLKDMNTILSIRDTKDTLVKEQVNLREVVLQAVQTLQEPLKNCGAELAIEIAESYTVSGNRAYLHSVFYNLLSNSIKYKADDRQLVIKITCFAGKNRGTVISFSDNGSGFDLAKAGNNVFRLYQRFHRTKKGRGIGLYLIKSHIEAMGGLIEVSSQENVGTRFLMHLN